MLGEISLADELDRKTIEALTRIADEQSRSLMTEREARLAIRAVFESVQGLVGDDVGEVLNVAMSQFSERGKRPIFPMHIKMAAGTWKIFPQSHYCLNMPVKSLAILAMQAFWLLTMVKRSTSPLFAMNLQSTASLSQSCLLWTLCYPDYGRQKTANGRDWRNSPSHWVLSMTRLRRTARSMIPI